MPPSQPSSDPVAPYLAALHEDKPLRVWSLIVTIFGDVVMRQGRDLAPPPVWTGNLLALLDRLGVEPGLARTALSRLVSGGVLERGKLGRNTCYRLGEASAREFAAAAEAIYGRRRPQPTGRFLLALIDRVADRAAARAALESQGFRFLSATTALKPDHAGAEPLRLPPQAIAAVAEAEGEAAVAARDLWRIEALQAAYAEFIDRFGGLAPDLPPEAAIAARIVLVHRMRRLLLRDPVLPAASLPAGWRGGEARALFAERLSAWEDGSEAWLDATGFRSGAAPQHVTEKLEA